MFFCLERIMEPSLNSKIYYQYKDEEIFPCVVLDGFLFRNERLSNVWSWINLKNGKKESGYGLFFTAENFVPNDEMLCILKVYGISID